MNKMAIITFFLGFGCCYLIVAKQEVKELPKKNIALKPSKSNKKTATSNELTKINSLNQQIHSLKKRLTAEKAKNNSTATVKISTDEISDSSHDTVQALTDEEIQNRLTAIKSEVELYVANKDGKALVTLVKELRNFGPAAFKQIVEIATILDTDRWREGNFSNSYNRHEFDKAFPKDIYAWALQDANFKEVGASFRIRSYTALPYTDVDNIDELLIQSFIKEDNRWGSRHLSETLSERPDEKTAQALINALYSEQEINERTREQMEEVVYGMPGSMVDDYIDQQINEATDEKRLNELKYTKIYRNPPASGFLISSIVKGSQAEKWGLKMGDTVVKYGDVELKNTSINRAKREVGDTKSITVTVLRDGQEITFEANPGQIGIDGDRVNQK